jgi:hypothetical protein
MVVASRQHDPDPGRFKTADARNQLRGGGLAVMGNASARDPGVV